MSSIPTLAIPKRSCYRTKKRIVSKYFLGDEFRFRSRELEKKEEKDDTIWVFERRVECKTFKKDMLKKCPDMKICETLHPFLFQYRKKTYLTTKSELLECGYCGVILPRKSLTRDHVKPRSDGFDLKDNCILACQMCNTRKGNLNLEDWLEKIAISHPIYFERIHQHFFQHDNKSLS